MIVLQVTLMMIIVAGSTDVDSVAGDSDVDCCR